jgi:hypothetical protein
MMVPRLACNHVWRVIYCDSKIQPQVALFFFLCDRPEHDRHQFQLILDFSFDILYKKVLTSMITWIIFGMKIS